ncbi:FAD:protein FMN transferase [Bacillaceae bacterium S4-13-56]
MKRKTLITVLSLMIMLVAGCSAAQGQSVKLLKEPYKQTAFLMGTVVTVKVYDEEKGAAVEKAIARIQELANQISPEEQDSEIDIVNDSAGIEPVRVSDDVFRLIKEGKRYSSDADGSFDITIGPLTRLWHIGFDDARKPEQSEIDVVLPKINYENVVLNEEEKTVFLKERGMKLDLGAIAKGFIADEAVKVLREENVTTAIVDLGGNIYVMGNNPSGNPWRTGIQDPFSARGKTIGIFPASDLSIVTSGVYERYIEVNGVRYHHLLNPADGYPFEGDIAGVSIISKYSIDGDALSTTIFSKGLGDGLKHLENMEGVEAVFVTFDKKVYITKGLKNFEITNDEFTMGN